MDNWFTSVPLAEDMLKMLKNKLTIIETIKKIKEKYRLHLYVQKINQFKDHILDFKKK